MLVLVLAISPLSGCDKIAEIKRKAIAFDVLNEQYGHIQAKYTHTTSQLSAKISENEALQQNIDLLQLELNQIKQELAVAELDKAMLKKRSTQRANTILQMYQ